MRNLEEFIAYYNGLKTEPERLALLDRIKPAIKETAMIRLVNLMNAESEVERTKLAEQFTHILQESDFREIVEVIDHISDEKNIFNTTKIRRYRTDIIKRIKTFVRSASNHDKAGESFGRVVFSPILKQRYMILVNFSGIGTESKDQHPAIVWNAENKRDDVLVIPCTSFNEDDTVENAYYFNIGQVGYIGGHGGLLPEETVVEITHIRELSRKRIQDHRITNPTTGYYGIAQISKQQQARIQEGFRVLFLGEKTLYQEEILGHLDKIPLFQNHNTQFSHLHRRYEVISNSPSRLVYKLFDEPTEYILDRKPTSSTKDQVRSALIQWTNAVAVYRSEKRILTTAQHRDLKYQELQKMIALPSTASKP